jgi:hypothetical protein
MCWREDPSPFHFTSVISEMRTSNRSLLPEEVVRIQNPSWSKDSSTRRRNRHLLKQRWKMAFDTQALKRTIVEATCVVQTPLLFAMCNFQDRKLIGSLFRPPRKSDKPRPLSRQNLGFAKPPKSVRCLILGVANPKTRQTTAKDKKKQPCPGQKSRTQT